ncbi:exonuclease V [Zopfochytrium polystomum]|nr:exonuclease V [Zopfochytrium polystomum]
MSSRHLTSLLCRTVARLPLVRVERHSAVSSEAARLFRKAPRDRSGALAAVRQVRGVVGGAVVGVVVGAEEGSGAAAAASAASRSLPTAGMEPPAAASDVGVAGMADAGSVLDSAPFAHVAAPAHGSPPPLHPSTPSLFDRSEELNPCASTSANALLLVTDSANSCHPTSAATDIAVAHRAALHNTASSATPTFWRPSLPSAINATTEHCYATTGSLEVPSPGIQFMGLSLSPCPGRATPNESSGIIGLCVSSIHSPTFINFEGAVSAPSPQASPLLSNHLCSSSAVAHVVNNPDDDADAEFGEDWLQALPPEVLAWADAVNSSGTQPPPDDAALGSLPPQSVDGDGVTPHARGKPRKRMVLDAKPLGAKYDKNGMLSVTDFASISWCEHQAYYQATTGVAKEVTPAMRKGTILHERLERQVSEVVEIKAKSREDDWAVRFINMMVNLETLFSKGIAREISVIGHLGPFLVHGIIDQIERRIVPDGNDPTVLVPRYFISDTKTRSTRNLPTKSTSAPARAQLAIYWKLYNDLAEGGRFDAVTAFEERMAPPPPPSVADGEPPSKPQQRRTRSKRRRLDMDAPLSDEVAAHAAPWIAQQQAATLRAVLAAAAQSGADRPPPRLKRSNESEARMDVDDSPKRSRRDLVANASEDEEEEEGMQRRRPRRRRQGDVQVPATAAGQTSPAVADGSSSSDSDVEFENLGVVRVNFVSGSGGGRAGDLDRDDADLVDVDDAVDRGVAFWTGRLVPETSPHQPSSLSSLSLGSETNDDDTDGESDASSVEARPIVVDVAPAAAAVDVDVEDAATLLPPPKMPMRGVAPDDASRRCGPCRFHDVCGFRLSRVAEAEAEAARFASLL